MRLSRALTATAAGLSLLVLSACSGSEEVQEDPTPVAPLESEAPANSPEPTESEEPAAPAVAGDYAAPGAEFPTSEDLNVPLVETWWDPETEGSESAEVAAVYSFGDVREGNPSDLSGSLGDDDVAKLGDFSLWYVSYTVSLAGGPLAEASHGISAVPSLNAVDTAGAPSAINFVFFDGGPDACPNSNLTALAKEGTTEACQIIAATKGEKIERLEFHGDTQGGKESPYDGNPATWIVE